MTKEIEVGKYYVGPDPSNTSIREIKSIEDGKVVYMSYSCGHGGSMGGGKINWDSMARWVGRDATEEEIASCHISEEDRERARSRMEEWHVIAKSALSNPFVITDEDLLAEVERRGLDRR
jgi:hypothetical protein